MRTAFAVLIGAAGCVWAPSEAVVAALSRSVVAMVQRIDVMKRGT
jgi:hypothetical protein